MTAFEDFIAKPESKKVYLAEVYPAQNLIDWDLTSGMTYTYEIPIVNLPQVSFLPQFEELTENGTALTEKTSIAEVEANAGSWFFDQSAKKVYIHTTGGDDPDGRTDGIYNYTILAFFHLYFGSEPKIFDNNYYYPRIAEGGLSDLSVSSRTIYFGTQTTGNGSLNLQNEDKFFDQLLKRFVWSNRNIRVLLGGNDLEYLEYAEVFRGSIIDWSGGDKIITFNCKDYRCLLQKKLPQDVFTIDQYPALSSSDEGKEIPIAYGYLENCPCVKIGTTNLGVYKITGHKIHKIIAVYNNGTACYISYITPDLDNGEFTILSGWGGGTPGTVTVDIVGKPLDAEEVYFSDEFSDNDISEYDTYGIASWTAAGGIVSADSSDTTASKLVHPLKKFSSGTIEVKVNSSVSGSGQMIGFVWNFVDTNNFKALVLSYNSSPQRIRLYNVAAGSWSNLTNDSITIASGTWYTLKLNVSKDGVATPYLDGTAKTSHDFGVGFTPNNVGLLVYNAMDGSFDDFSIKLDYIWSGSQIVQDICENFLGIDSDDIDTASFENSTENASEYLAAYIKSGEEAARIIERCCFANLCRFVIGEDGKVYYLFWDESDSSTYTIDTYEILGDYSAQEKEDEIYSTCRVKYNLGTGTQWSYKTFSDSRVTYLYGKDEAKEFETYLTIEEDAEDLVYRLFNLLRSPATKISFKTKIRGTNLKIGDVITIKRNRGISRSGRHNDRFRILGLRKNFSRMETTIDAVSDSTALGEGLCDISCQQTCETACQLTCEINCKDTCLLNCQGTCQVSCTGSCEVSPCQDSCELNPACENNCMSGCQNDCDEEITCEFACEQSCQTTCQIEGCQTACQIGVCQSVCESSICIRQRQT